MKEMMRESDELRLAKDEAVTLAKESEKKNKTMEADMLHLQDVLTNRRLRLAQSTTAS